MAEELFNVVVFDAEGYSTYVSRNISAREAVETSKRLADRADNLPGIDRIMITDSDDFANFLWQRGKGVVYPPRQESP